MESINIYHILWTHPSGMWTHPFVDPWRTWTWTSKSSGKWACKYLPAGDLAIRSEGFLSHGDTRYPQIIHFCLSFSIINQPFGVSPFMETSKLPPSDRKEIENEIAQDLHDWVSIHPSKHQQSRFVPSIAAPHSQEPSLSNSAQILHLINATANGECWPYVLQAASWYGDGAGA